MPTIRMGTIASLVRSVLDPTGTRSIEWDEPIARTIPGGAAALAAYAVYLNKAPQFAGYGLALEPTDMAKVKRPRDLVKVVGNWFTGAGWTLTL